MTMQFKFNNPGDKWRDVSADVFGIPAEATQVVFREKPEFGYNVTWTNQTGSYNENHATMNDAIKHLGDLTDIGEEPNLYIRKMN